MTSAFSWQNSISLCPASFRTPRLNLLVTPGVSFLGLILKGLVGLHRIVQLQLLQCYWLGIGLDYCDIECFALEMNRNHSVVFEIASKYCISDSFVDHDDYSISSKRFLPTVVDIMVI